MLAQARLLSPEFPKVEPLSLPHRITFVAGTLGQGGAERQLYYYLKVLQQSGVQLSLLCLNRGEFWEQRINDDLKIPVRWVGQSRFRVLRLVRMIRELRRDIPEVIQSQHFYTNLYVSAAARLLQIPEVGAIRNDVTSEIDSSPLGKLGLRTPRILAANSKAGIATAVGLGVPRERCFFLPNVVDTDRFAPVEPRARPVLRLIAVGRLVRQKRLDRFVRLLAELKAATQQPFEGVIVGAGPLKESLEQQAAQLGLDARTLTFRGAVADVGAEYQDADIFVLTSDFEGTPNVVLEAMSSGLPVVTTPVGGLPEVIRDGETGLIARAEEQDEIKTAVLRLINNPELRAAIGTQARRYVEAEHSLYSLPRCLEALYLKVRK